MKKVRITVIKRIFREAYANAALEGHKASDCIKCRQCEGACPQHLHITDLLEQAREMME